MAPQLALRNYAPVGCHQVADSSIGGDDTELPEEMVEVGRYPRLREFPVRYVMNGDSRCLDGVVGRGDAHGLAVEGAMYNVVNLVTLPPVGRWWPGA